MVAVATLSACSAGPSEEEESTDGTAAESALTAGVGAGTTLETTSRLRLRESPSKSARTILVLPFHAKVVTVDGVPQNGFYQVDYQGQRGWAHGAWLRNTSSSSSSPSPSPSPGPVANGERWQPHPGTKWQWQLQGSIDTSLDVAAYDIDLWDTPKSTIDSLHAAGKRVICYFSAGSFENWRADVADFPSSAKGKVMDGWPNERWVDVRNSAVREVMKKRMDMAVQKGCDGVEPDNVDGYSNDTGFSLSGADQLSFNRFLAQEAHARGLAVGLKNDLEQVGQLVSSFDFAVNEQCFQYDECDQLTPFVDANKAVLQVEYGGASLASSICPKANARNFDTQIKKLELDAWRVPCR